jgi:pilus assembly protein Flp/PilA
LHNWATYHADMNAFVSLRSRVLAWLPDLEDDESGQGMVEYAFILILVAMVVIVTLIIVGNQTRNLWLNLGNGMTHAVGG